MAAAAISSDTNKFHYFSQSCIALVDADKAHDIKGFYTDGIESCVVCAFQDDKGNGVLFHCLLNQDNLTTLQNSLKWLKEKDGGDIKFYAYSRNRSLAQQIMVHRKCEDICRLCELSEKPIFEHIERSVKLERNNFHKAFMDTVSIEMPLEVAANNDVMYLNYMCDKDALVQVTFDGERSLKATLEKGPQDLLTMFSEAIASEDGSVCKLDPDDVSKDVIIEDRWLKKCRENIERYLSDNGESQLLTGLLALSDFDLITRVDQMSKMLGKIYLVNKALPTTATSASVFAATVASTDKSKIEASPSSCADRACA